MDIKVKENRYNINLDDLIVLGKRINNSKRNFLFISKVLGKHIEVKPNICKEIGVKLASLVYGQDNDKIPYEDKEKICVLGFAETATGLGMAVASTIKDSYYITTTREDITEIKSILKFEEEHSHATTHKCFPLDKSKIINADKIILVDDEITTGKSMINIIKELKKVTNVREYIVLSILDWRAKEYKNEYTRLESEEKIKVEVLSLISGEISTNDKKIYIDNDEELLTEKTAVFRTNNLNRINIETRLNPIGESYLADTGRFGVTFKEMEELEEQCRETAIEIEKLLWKEENEKIDLCEVNNDLKEINKKKILVLGHGENIYIPCRIASYLKGDVYFKSTTRSPIYCEDKEGYPIREKHIFEHNEVKYYFYNKSKIEKEYDKVILLTEDDLNIKLTNNMIAVRI